MADSVEPILCGVDVAQATLEIAQSDRPVISVANTGEAIAEWLETLAGRAHIAIEATGAYHEQLLVLVVAAGHEVYVVNGKQLHHYREAVGPRAKTDMDDARLLLRYVTHERSKLRPVKVLDSRERQLWSLLKRRTTLVEARSRVKMSLRGDPALRSTSDELDAALRRGIAEVERLMTQLAQELDWEPEIKRCQAIPGIGPLSALALVACFHRGDFQRSDQYVAFMGLDVRVRDSGKCKGRRKLTKRGNPELRRLLFNGAMSAAKMPSIRPLYKRHRAKGLSSTAALVAMSRKLARIAFAVLSKNEVYDEKLSNWACVSP